MIWLGLLARGSRNLRISTSPVTGIESHATSLAFLHGHWRSNSGFHACIASTLPINWAFPQLSGFHSRLRFETWLLGAGFRRSRDSDLPQSLLELLPAPPLCSAPPDSAVEVRLLLPQNIGTRPWEESMADWCCLIESKVFDE